MALLGSALQELIEEHQLSNTQFNGVIHIGNENYIKDGAFISPEEFKFTTEYTSSVSTARKIGENYLITSNCRSTSFTAEEVQKVILSGCWRIVLVF